MTHLKTRCLMLALALFGFLCIPAHADVITFTTRTAFNAAAPNLPVETFESGLVAAGSVTVCTGNVSSTMGGGCFPTGGLLPGVVFSATPGPGPTTPPGFQLAVLGANIPGVGNTSRVIGPNTFGDVLNLAFFNANAVGFDVFAGPGGGNVRLSVFDTSFIALIGTFTVSAPVGGTFFGVVNTTGGIGRIQITSLSSTPGELIDNVAFGTASSATAVPEPTTMLLLGTGLAGVMAKVRRRKADTSEE